MGRRTRYAVVSCHVERPLDDGVWSGFAALQRRRPGGFAIAALIRPPDDAAREDRVLWLERAREAAERGPLGHHTHWTAPDHARPTGDGIPAQRVREEAAWLRSEGIRATLFCGGGWYSDAGVAEACAELGYVDCTATAYRPAYLPPDAPRLELAAPARIALRSGSELLEVPSTHSVGMLAHEVLSPNGLQADVVHVHFHDTDLVDRKRRAALVWGLRALARRRRPTDLDALASLLIGAAPGVTFAEAARPVGTDAA
jgi:hypothetical protein